ncbi:MAG TPA: preprotein translocase subunit YajC [Actinomycetota bacterium]
MLGSFIPLIAQGGNSSSGGGASILLFFVVMGGIFYLLLIRPQQRQRRAQRSLVEGLDVGDEVITMSGIFGTIRAVDEESITLEVAPGIEMKFLKGAVARKLVYGEDESEDQDGGDHGEAGEQS